MPTTGTAAASTALPQPPKTSQKVPMNSAAMRLLSDTRSSFCPGRSRRRRSPTAQRGAARRAEYSRTAPKMHQAPRQTCGAVLLRPAPALNRYSVEHLEPVRLVDDVPQWLAADEAARV